MKTPIFDFASEVVGQEVGPAFMILSKRSNRPTVKNFIIPMSLAATTVALVGTTIINDIGVNIASAMLTPFKRKHLNEV